jgi:hypothetical protein
MSQPSPYSDNTPSPHLRSALSLSITLIQRRNHVRRLLGDRYAKAIEPYRQVIRGLAAEKRVPLADAGLEIAKKLDGAGHDPSCAIAALVEEMERSR